jgi:hypothetical protein
VQVEPGLSMEHASFQRLKLKYDKLLLSFALSFNLCRYKKGAVCRGDDRPTAAPPHACTTSTPR